MPTVGERRAQVALFVQQYSDFSPLVHRAKSIGDVVNAVANQIRFNSGSRLTWSQAYEQMKADPKHAALMRAYGQS